ncbi:unnamed protein product [Paramecium octaurelia]|uniref:OTU domain-containing protein n=1 Tax=Paramecium octaurelia TaxID=43137 RepID=A0A8S1UWD9_PAROT|nr:unnamed protein product [Paramecium octaurelia]
MSQNKGVSPHYMQPTQCFLNKIQKTQRDHNNKPHSAQHHSEHVQKGIEQNRRDFKSHSPLLKRVSNIQSQKQQKQKQDRQNYHKQHQQGVQQNHLKGTKNNYFAVNTKIKQNNSQEKQISQNQRVKNLNNVRSNQKKSPQQQNLYNKTQIKQIDNAKLQKSLPLKQEQQTQKDKCDAKSQTTKSPCYVQIQKNKQNKDQDLKTPVKQKQNFQKNSNAQQQTNKQYKNTNSKQNEMTIKKEQKHGYKKQQIKVEQQNQQPIKNEQSNQQPIHEQSNKQPNKIKNSEQKQITVEQPNIQPIKNDLSNQQSKYAEEIDNESLDIQQINQQALNLDKQNQQLLNIELLNKSLETIQIAFDQKRLKKTVEISKQLIQMSSQLRTVEQNYSYYLQKYDDKQGLFSHYSIKQLAVKNVLKNYCQRILYVRGDGNCFYTAFGYQFLRLVLINYNDTQFNEFLNFAMKIKFKIYYKDFQIANDQLEQLLIEEFLYNLQQIRKIENQQQRIDELYQKYREFNISDDGNGCFYFLSTLFFRNLSNQLLEHSEMKALVEDRENLLIWETECNNNEIIIATLAQQLKINIKLLFFNGGQFELREYEKDHNDEIILLIQPGHYNIGFKN